MTLIKIFPVRVSWYKSKIAGSIWSSESRNMYFLAFASSFRKENIF